MTRTPSKEPILVLQAMVSMAAADGNMHESEIESIRAIYSQVAGDVVTAAQIDEAPDTYRNRGLTFADLLAQERQNLTQDMQETILRSAYRVLLADGRVGARERKKLMDFANALKISEIHRGVIFEDVEHTHH